MRPFENLVPTNVPPIPYRDPKLDCYQGAYGPLFAKGQFGSIANNGLLANDAPKLARGHNSSKMDPLQSITHRLINRNQTFIFVSARRTTQIQTS